MKSASADLVTLLTQKRQFFMVDLFTFTFADSSVLRYCSSDIVAVVGARTFSPAGPLLKRGRTRTVIGVEVDTLELQVSASAAHTINGVPWLQAIANGVFDGARVELERAFAPSPEEAFAGSVYLFSGQVADSEVTTLSARLTVASDLQRLNIQMPRNLYQPGCLHSLYDTGCGVSKAGLASPTTIASGSTRSTLNCGLTQADGYFTLGEMVCTDGPNAGVRRTIKAYSTGVVGLSYPLPYAPTVGDSFTAYPGCDKRLTTCQTKFSNQARFRAFPFVPVPEAAL